VPANPDARPWRKYLRFSVRALIVLVLVIGLAVGWIVRSAQVQRDAVAAIAKAGGAVGYDWEHGRPGGNGAPRAPEWLVDALGVDYFGHVVAVESFTNASDAVLTHVLCLPELYELSLKGPNVTDSEIARLKELTKLTSLGLDGTQVSDAGIARLTELTKLTSLSLRFTKVTDAGLAHLTRLTNLSSLDLAGTGLTDAGSVYLKGLTNLEVLDLRGTEVTDAGLVHLRGLKKLEFLELEGTRVTDAGINELAAALPRVEINR
jgi:Leucine rich repeat/Leucine Rich repeat